MKLKFKIFNVLLVATVLFWFVYTVVFLFIDGWHWKAEEGSLEAVFDAIVGTSFTFCAILLLSLTWNMANILIKTVNEFENDHQEEQKEDLELPKYSLIGVDTVLKFSESEIIEHFFNHYVIIAGRDVTDKYFVLLLTSTPKDSVNPEFRWHFVISDHLPVKSYSRDEIILIYHKR